MIKSVYVDGLKSLKDFKLVLKPGLNVLAGPNGSGKSNILTAFELISRLSHLDNLNSTDKIGSVAVEELFNKFEPDRKIELVVDGEIQDNIEYRNEKGILANDDILLKYNYKCTIRIDDKIKYSIFYDMQSIDIEIALKGHVHEFSINYCDEKIQIGNFNATTMNIFFHKSISENLNFIESDRFTNNEYKKLSSAIAYTQLSFMDLRYNSIIYALSRSLKPLGIVVSELESATVFNINPQSIKKEINQITPPNIDKNGGGFLSTLLNVYELHNGTSKPTFNNSSPSNCYSEIFETVKYSLNKISSEIKDIRVELAGEKGNGSRKIVGSAVFESGKELPIEMLSDGSLQWLTLVTALLTNEGLFVLEEPEKNINLTMQQLFIELMRETLEDNKKTILFTTHSETILDLLNPEEVVLTYFHEGYTVAKPIKEPQKLKQAIHDTGFGLGWYFATGEFDQQNVL